LTDEEKQKIEQNLTASLNNIYNMKDEKLDEADYNKISFELFPKVKPYVNMIDNTKGPF
jgi:hypothetical protein